MTESQPKTKIRILIDQFLEHLEIEKGRSLKTIENYRRYLETFVRQSKVEGPEDIDLERVRLFRIWLNRQPVRAGSGETMKRKTQNYYLIALRAFLKYLAKREVSSLSPEKIELAKVPERDIDIISIEELNLIRQASKGDGLRDLRNRAIIELLFSTGLRLSELCSLSRDINTEAEEMSIRGKGDKVRIVFLSVEARQAIKKYLEARTDTDEALFIRISRDYGRESDRSDLRLTPRSVERIIKQLGAKAGVLKRVTPHTIRHAFATDLLRNGADLRSVQALLGHAHIATTQVYTHVTDSYLKEIHKKYHDKSN